MTTRPASNSWLPRAGQTGRVEYLATRRVELDPDAPAATDQEDIE